MFDLFEIYFIYWITLISYDRNLFDNLELSIFIISFIISIVNKDRLLDSFSQ